MRMPFARRAALACCVVGMLSPVMLVAQGSSAVHLRLRPLLHDTLRMRVDQTIEMGRSAHSGREPGPFSDLASIVMEARLVVESVDAGAAVVLAVADSVRVTTSPGYAGLATLRSLGALEGQRFRFRIQPDGSTALAGGDPWGGAALGGFLAQLPATLPTAAVVPGESWSRVITIPMAGVTGGSAELGSTFRLDSLSRSGEYAYISLRGQLQRASPPRQGNDKGRREGRGALQTSGDVSGTIVMDLRRGWITEARSSISLLSEQAQGTGSGASVTRVRVRIIQWTRVL